MPENTPTVTPLSEEEMQKRLQQLNSLQGSKPYSQMTVPDQFWAKAHKELSKPFPIECHKFKPGSVSGNRAMVIWYIDARDVMDRLDEVFGPENWKDHYEFAFDKTAAVCQLSLRQPGTSEWITKSDAGSESSQPDSGDRVKAAFSDAIKRAAVKWGIGRYLYSLPNQWHDYDPQKRRFVKTPTFPGGTQSEERQERQEQKETQPHQQVTTTTGAEWRDFLFDSYKSAATPEDLAELDQQTTPQVLALISPADRNLLRIARSDCKRRIEENAQAANLPTD